MGSLDLMSSHALIFSNISAGTGSVLRRRRPEGIWCDTAFHIVICPVKICIHTFKKKTKKHLFTGTL